jgi:hypothetical protein
MTKLKIYFEESNKSKPWRHNAILALIISASKRFKKLMEYAKYEWEHFEVSE